MALNKDLLGQDIYDALSAFNNKDSGTTGNIETARLNFCKAIANAVIEHFKANAEIPALGLIAPAGTAGGPVTGEAAII